MVDRLSERAPASGGRTRAPAAAARWSSGAARRPIGDGCSARPWRSCSKGYRDEFLTFRASTTATRTCGWSCVRCRSRIPAFWYAGDPEHAGELGMNFIGAGPISRKESVQKYLEAWNEGQANNGPCTATWSQPLYGAMRHMFIADTDAEAVERVRGRMRPTAALSEAAATGRRAQSAGRGAARMAAAKAASAESGNNPDAARQRSSAPPRPMPTRPWRPNRCSSVRLRRSATTCSATRASPTRTTTSARSDGATSPTTSRRSHCGSSPKKSCRRSDRFRA